MYNFLEIIILSIFIIVFCIIIHIYEILIYFQCLEQQPEIGNDLYVNIYSDTGFWLGTL